MGNIEDRTRFNTEVKPNWCPGCGNYGIQAALKKALLDMDLNPHQVVLSSGIGCSGKIPHWINIYGLHSLHGRTLPVAAGIKLANNNMVVIAEGGDGDGYSEGMNHFIHASRRNINLTYIVHNNGVFSLTTGQSSSTGKKGFISNTTPFGAIEQPFHPVALAIAAGCSFAARGYSGDTNQLSELIATAIKHQGFAFIDVLQVCVTYNPKKNYEWYKERLYKIDYSNHDTLDRNKSLTLAFSDNEDKLATGIFYQSKSTPYENSLPQIKKVPLKNHNIENIDISNLFKELM